MIPYQWSSVPDWQRMVASELNLVTARCPVSDQDTTKFLRADYTWVTPPYLPTTGGTLTGDLLVPDEAYGASWDGSTEVPTKNAVYDKIQTLGGGGGWSLAGTWAWSANVAQVDFTGLAGATDILVLCRGITLSLSGIAVLRVSVNNGVSFFATSGDYVSITAAGVESASTGLAMYDTSATAARSGGGIIHGANVTGAPRLMTSPMPVTTQRMFVADTANDIDAIRVIPSGGGDITGGSIYVFKR